MRCKACNNSMQDYEIASRNPISGEPEEMCRSCINLSSSYSDGLGPQVEIMMDVPLLDLLPNGPKSMDN